MAEILLPFSLSYQITASTRLNLCPHDLPSALLQSNILTIIPLCAEKLRELWIIPIFFVITTTVSMAVAFMLGWVFRLKRSQRSFAIAAAMFMNSNSLPIALMQSLVVTVPSLKWSRDDNKNAMIGRALTYLVLYSTLGMVLRWSYGVKLLSQADPETTENGAPHPTDEEPLIDSEETAFPPSQEEYGVFHRNPSDESATMGRLSANPSIVVEHVDRVNSPNAKFFYSFPNTPTRKSSALPQNGSASTLNSTQQSDEDEDDDMLEFPARRRVTEPTSSLWQSRRRRMRRRLSKTWHSLYEFMTVPLWAALLSLVVACIQPLQHALENHVQPIKGALTQAGNCSIPLTLVVLGAYFYSPSDPEAQKQQARSRGTLPEHASTRRGRSISTSWSHTSLLENVREMLKMKKRTLSADGVVEEERKSKRPGETKTVVIAVLARMVITPLLLLPLMALSARFDLHQVFDE
jgi:auxin efflux carrier family protein